MIFWRFDRFGIGFQRHFYDIRLLFRNAFFVTRFSSFSPSFLMLVYPVSASFLLSNGPLQRPGSQGVGGRSALTIKLWATIFGQKTPKKLPSRRPEASVVPTLTRFGAEDAPRRHFH